MSLRNGWTEELDRLKAENARQAAEIERLKFAKDGLLLAIKFHSGEDNGIMGLRKLVDRATAAEARVAELEADKARMDWLEQQYVKVSLPLRWGSRELFWAQSDEEETISDLRAKIDAALGAKP